ncbi:MAG: hypothetical protein IPM54_11175 [Polyangiaceae bacterium]|nr:hypothetical protein [Polyangiaceae bacterium]
MAPSSPRNTTKTEKLTPKTTSSRKSAPAKTTKAQSVKAQKLLEGAPAKSRKPDIVAVLAEFGFPTGPGRGLCFTCEDADLFERGYPELRRLTDEPIEPKRAFELAEKALDAIDPCFRIDVPRAIAKPFLLGYRVGPLLFVDSNHPTKNAQLRVERAALMHSDRAIDQKLLDETLEQHGFDMGDTYASWRWPKVLYLYEEFIGTEKVARSVAKFLILAAKELKRWGFAGQDPYRTNAAAHYIALTLPWLLRRVESTIADEIRAQMLEVPAPEKMPTQSPRAFGAMLHWIANPSRNVHETLKCLEFPLALRRDDAEFVVRESKNPKVIYWSFARVCWLMGTRLLVDRDVTVRGQDFPRLVDKIALFRDPGVVRLMAQMAAQRAGKKAAGDWLKKHADYARPILEKLASLEDEKEVKAARLALELIETVQQKGPIVEALPLDDDALEREVEGIFEELGKRLRKAPHRDAEVAAIREAYDAYAEARSAAGDPIPEAYFTHRFGDFGLGKWAMLAVDAID